MTLHKLKVAALQHEQREDWAGAIELYRQAIREAEGGAEGGDPSLYNRVGDLALKAGDARVACEAWEQAVNRYSELGFLNSAVALCGKILRVEPTRLQTYLELARLHTRKRVLYDVQQNLRLYFDQMTAAGRAEAARKAIGSLGDEFPGYRDLEALIDQLLGRETGVEAAPRDAGDGATPGLVFLDTGPITIERASDPQDEAPANDVSAESIIEGIEVEASAEAMPVAGFEPTLVDAEERPESAPEGGAVEGLIGVTQLRDLPEVARMEGLDSAPVVEAPAAESVAGLEATAQSSGTEVVPDDDAADGPIGGELVFLPTAGTDGPALTGDAPDAAPAIDPLGNRLAAEALLEQGDRGAAITALEQSLAGYEAGAEWLHAFHVATELVEAEPASINRHQARVEMASKLGDPMQLCTAYADLADTLLSQGSVDKAVAVYRRVLEIDDGHARARAALRAMAPNQASTVPDGFIDLGAELIDDHPTSTRMRTEKPVVADTEEETFRDALAEFKRALDQNLPIEDHQAHYDLGIAFKEMGLLDEAISEFQKALRAPEVRLRTSEALGEVFFDQGRPAVAEAVLRGVENGSEGDAEKIGVLYWLGRSLESQARRDEAVRYYQRIIAVDLGFRDVSDRLTSQLGEHG